MMPEQVTCDFCGQNIDELYENHLCLDEDYEEEAGFFDGEEEEE